MILFVLTMKQTILLALLIAVAIGVIVWRTVRNSNKLDDEETFPH